MDKLKLIEPQVSKYIQALRQWRPVDIFGSASNYEITPYQTFNDVKADGCKGLG